MRLEIRMGTEEDQAPACALTPLHQRRGPIATAGGPVDQQEVQVGVGNQVGGRVNPM